VAEKGKKQRETKRRTFSFKNIRAVRTQSSGRIHHHRLPSGEGKRDLDTNGLKWSTRDFIAKKCVRYKGVGKSLAKEISMCLERG